MNKKRILVSLLTLVMTASIFAGCGKKEVAAPTDKLDAKQEVNVAGYDFTSLDPSVISDAESFTTLNNVMEGLMIEVLKDGKATNVLAGASDMKISADGTVYTFTLRDSKWSDGVAVKASDYVFSWRRLCDPATAADYMYFLDEIGVKNGLDIAEGKAKPETLGIKAIDDKTLEVTLAQPTPAFQAALSFKGLVPQREDLFKSLGDQYGQDITKMVYNGAFTVSEYQKGAKIVYKKNANYWNAKEIKLEQANCLIINESTTLVKMFETKELDMTGATGDDVKKLADRAKTGEFKHITGMEATVFYYTYNTKSDILKNNKVRLALSLGYDRQTQINAVWKRFVPALGLVPTKITLGKDEYRTSVKEPLKEVKEDPKALLEAGLKELGKTAADVKLKMLFGPATSISSAQGAFIQQQLEKNLGIKIELVYSVDGPAYFKARTKGEFDICAGGWGADYNDVASFFPLFTTSNGNNNGKYSSPKYDELVSAAGKEMDPAKRLVKYQEAEKLLLVDDAAVSPYFYKDVNSFQHTYLKGMYLPLFGGYYDLRGVYTSGKQ